MTPAKVDKILEQVEILPDSLSLLMNKRLTDLPELVVAYILGFCGTEDLVGSVELCCSSPLLHRDLRLLRLGPR